MAGIFVFARAVWANRRTDFTRSVRVQPGNAGVRRYRFHRHVHYAYAVRVDLVHLATAARSHVAAARRESRIRFARGAGQTNGAGDLPGDRGVGGGETPG